VTTDSSGSQEEFGLLEGRSRVIGSLSTHRESSRSISQANGFSKVHPSTIRKLAEALGVEPRELVRREQ